MPDPFYSGTMRNGICACYVQADQALLLTLARLRMRHYDLESMRSDFGMDGGTMSKLINALCTWLVKTWGWSIGSIQRWTERMDTYANAFRNKGVPQPLKIWSAIDGTVIRTACPSGDAKNGSEEQEEVYSGHKRKHRITYQALGTPDGLVVYLSSPVPARRHDRYGFAESSLPNERSRLWSQYSEFDIYYIFGDKAYRNLCGVMRNYGRHEHFSDAQRQLQRTLNKVRAFVEWLFAEINSSFPFVNEPTKMKLDGNPVDMYYTVAVLLYNIRACERRTGVAPAYFSTTPPSTEAFLGYGSLYICKSTETLLYLLLLLL